MLPLFLFVCFLPLFVPFPLLPPQVYLLGLLAHCPPSWTRTDLEIPLRHYFNNIAFWFLTWTFQMQPHAPQWFFCLFVHLFVLGVYVCVCFFFPWFLTITERNTSSLDWDPRVKLFMKTNFSCHFCEWLCKELYGVALQWKIFVICRLSMNNIRKSCLSYSLLSLSWRLFIRNGTWIYLKAKNQYQLEKLNMSEVWTLLLSVTISEDNRNDGNKGYMMSLFFFFPSHLWENACA